MVKKVLYVLLIVAIWVGAIYVFIMRNDFDNHDRRLCYRTGGQWMTSGEAKACAALDEYSCRANIKCQPEFTEPDAENSRDFIKCQELAVCVCLGDKLFDQVKGCLQESQ